MLCDTILLLPLVNFDENSFNFHNTVTWGPLITRTLETAGADRCPEDAHWLTLHEERKPQKVTAERTGWKSIHGKLTGGKQCDGKRCNKRHQWRQPWGVGQATVTWENGEETRTFFRAQPSLSQFGSPLCSSIIPTLWSLRCTKRRYKRLLSSILHGFGNRFRRPGEAKRISRESGQTWPVGVALFPTRWSRLRSRSFMFLSPAAAWSVLFQLPEPVHSSVVHQHCTL